MDNQEKILARILFENKIFKADGNAFESLFTEIMNFAEPDFQQIKPWGNIGDKKNDGYIPSKGIYYQVFAPEDIRKSYPEVIEKLKTDLKGLLAQWSPVNEFYFVVNDKFKGVNPEAEQTIKSLKDTYKLDKTGFLTPKDLNRILFSLSDELIYKVTGFYFNIDKITNLDFTILSEVIDFIMKQPPRRTFSTDVKLPEWDEKIKFNNLSDFTKSELNYAYHKIGSLNIFLRNNSFLAEELQKKLIGIYQQIIEDWKDLSYIGENVFWEVVNICMPKNTEIHQSAVICILSKYFESCDILEEPKRV
jgi:hypothetical protein